MNDILSRWASLLTNDEPRLEHFDPESEQDLLLLQSRDVDSVSPVLRLLPDIFAKYYKCLELVKQWWVLAHQIYPDLPFQRRPPDSDDEGNDKNGDVDDLMTSLQDSGDGQSVASELSPDKDIRDMKNAIRDSMSVLKALEEELEALERREEKFEILKDTFEKVTDDIEMQTKAKQELVELRDDLTQNGLADDADEVEVRISRQDDTLKLLDFQHALLGQDYLVHMEVRPSIIRFHGDVVARVHDARRVMDEQLEALEQLMVESTKTRLSEVTRPSHVTKSSDVTKRDDVTKPEYVRSYKTSVNESEMKDQIETVNTQSANDIDQKSIPASNSSKQTQNKPAQLLADSVNHKIQQVSESREIASKLPRPQNTTLSKDKNGMSKSVKSSTSSAKDPIIVSKNTKAQPSNPPFRDSRVIDTKLQNNPPKRIMTIKTVHEKSGIVVSRRAAKSENTPAGKQEVDVVKSSSAQSEKTRLINDLRRQLKEEASKADVGQGTQAKEKASKPDISRGRQMGKKPSNELTKQQNESIVKPTTDQNRDAKRLRKDASPSKQLKDALHAKEKRDALQAKQKDKLTGASKPTVSQTTTPPIKQPLSNKSSTTSMSRDDKSASSKSVGNTSKQVKVIQLSDKTKSLNEATSKQHTSSTKETKSSTLKDSPPNVLPSQANSRKDSLKSQQVLSNVNSKHRRSSQSELPDNSEKRRSSLENANAKKGVIRRSSQPSNTPGHADERRLSEPLQNLENVKKTTSSNVGKRKSEASTIDKNNNKRHVALIATEATQMQPTSFDSLKRAAQKKQMAAK